MSNKKETNTPTVMEDVASSAEENVQPNQNVETDEQPAQENVVSEAAVEEIELEAPLFRVAFCRGLNLRERPGMNSPVLQVLVAGTEISIDPVAWVADGTGVWFPVTFDGVNGFVNGQYRTPVAV